MMNLQPRHIAPMGGASTSHNPGEIKNVQGSAQFHDTSSLQLTQCHKHPGHLMFIPLTSLSSKDLPSPFCDDPRWASMLRARAQDTVKLIVKHVSQDRPCNTTFGNFRGRNLPRSGSGTAFWPDGGLSQAECTVPGCTLGGPGHKVFGPFRVVTVQHLVYDMDEANKTEIEFFHDDPKDRSSVCLAQVVSIDKGPLETDRTVLKCVTHDARIPEQLERAKRERDGLLTELEEPEGASMVVLISHPHGTSKCVSVGQLHHLEEQGPVKEIHGGSMKLRDCFLTYSTPSCPGSGGGSVTLWERNRRAFAPHSSTTGPGQNQSALGWVSI